MTRLLRRQHLLAVNWQWNRDQQSMVVAEEMRETRLLKDGTLQQETRDVETPKRHMPGEILKQRNLWARYLEGAPMDQFLIQYRQRKIRVLGPPNRLAVHAPEWSLIWSLTSVARGPEILIWCDRRGAPPSRKLIERLQRLRAMPALTPVPAKGIRVVFEGDVLVSFLHSALNHIKTVSKDLGVWRDDIETHTSETEVHAHPLRRVFLPEVTETLPVDAWIAGSYDSDRQLLYAWRYGDRAWEYRCFHLEQPLYRLFPKLTFGEQRETFTVHDIQYEMPGAVLQL